MNAIDLDRLLTTNAVTSKSFIGVYSCDRLPITTRKIFSLIVNTDTGDKPGTHWQAIYVNNRNAFFFCSLGYSMGPYITFYLRKFNVTQNKKAPQLADESTCGGYCVLVLTLLSRGHSFEDVCTLFDTIPHDDKVVRAVLQEEYDMRIP